MGAGDDLHGHPTRVDEVDRQAADVLGQGPHGGARGVGEAQHVDLVLCGERHADEPRSRAPAHGQARGVGVGAAQLQRVLGAQCRREPERVREGLGANEVGLLELQPGDVAHLDHRIGRPALVFAVAGALFAVQVLMRTHGVAHDCLLMF